MIDIEFFSKRARVMQNSTRRAFAPLEIGRQVSKQRLDGVCLRLARVAHGKNFLDSQLVVLSDGTVARIRCH